MMVWHLMHQALKWKETTSSMVKVKGVSGISKVLYAVIYVIHQTGGQYWEKLCPRSFPISLSVWRTMLPILVSCFRLGHGIQSAVPITTKLCIGGLQGFQHQIHLCKTASLLRRWIVLLQHEGDFLSLLQKPAVSF